MLYSRFIYCMWNIEINIKHKDKEMEMLHLIVVFKFC